MSKDDSARKLAIAKRCQILIGSFDGQSIGCPCESPRDCKLSREEQIRFIDHPQVEKSRILMSDEYKVKFPEND